MAPTLSPHLDLSPQPALTDRHLSQKTICIFENHAHALLPWSRWATQNKKKLKLISLDHHSDTNSCYLRSLFKDVGRNLDEIERLRTLRIDSIDFKNPAQILSALTGLHHDEHIHAAIRLGMISQAYIIQHSFDHIDFEISKKGMNVLPTEINLKASSTEVKNTYFDQILETEFLTRQLDAFKKLPLPLDIEKDDYILDIDLDVFKSKQSVQPHDKSLFLRLISKSIGITIAQETQWVETLKREPGLNSHFLKNALLEFIKL